MSKQSRLNRKFDRIKRLEESGELKRRKQGNRALRKLQNNRLAIVGGAIFLVILLSCIFAPFLASYSPTAVDMKAILKMPSGNHLFGTDKLGRDVFARVLYGGRMSISIGFGSALGCAVIGVLAGCYSGYRGGQSAKNIVIIFIICGWGSSFRMARSQVLSIREEEYVQSLKVFGLNPFVICYKHILPNALSPIIVNVTLSTAMFILEEAALSFLGLGVPLEVPTWGNILNAAQDLYTLENSWWLWLPTGIVVSLFVMSINFLGDGIRDTTDPTQQG